MSNGNICKLTNNGYVFHDVIVWEASWLEPIAIPLPQFVMLTKWVSIKVGNSFCSNRTNFYFFDVANPQNANSVHDVDKIVILITLVTIQINAFCNPAK